MKAMKSRKQIKSDRLWKHWLSFMEPEPFGPNLLRMEDYDPEKYRSAFERFQASGRKGLTEDELRGIHPLIAAQKSKEITLTSLAEESMEWWVKGDGWIYPWLHTLGGKLDRLMRVAILRTVASIKEDPHAFFERHPGIPKETKARYFGIRVQTLSR